MFTGTVSIPGSALGNLMLSADGTRAVQGSSSTADGQITVTYTFVDTATGATTTVAATLPDGDGTGGQAQVSDDGTIVALVSSAVDYSTSTYTTRVTFFDSASGLTSFVSMSGEAFGDLVLSAEGAHAAVLTMTGHSTGWPTSSIRVIDVDTGTFQTVAAPEASDAYGSATFSPRQLATGGTRDYLAIAWDIENGDNSETAITVVELSSAAMSTTFLPGKINEGMLYTADGIHFTAMSTTVVQHPVEYYAWNYTTHIAVIDSTTGLSAPAMPLNGQSRLLYSGDGSRTTLLVTVPTLDLLAPTEIRTIDTFTGAMSAPVTADPRLFDGTVRNDAFVAYAPTAQDSGSTLVFTGSAGTGLTPSVLTGTAEWMMLSADGGTALLSTYVAESDGVGAPIRTATLRVIDVVTGSVRSTVSAAGYLTTAALSDDGAFAAAVFGTDTILINTATGATTPYATPTLPYVRFSADSRSLLIHSTTIGSDAIVATEQTVVDTTSGTATTSSHGGYLYGLVDNNGQLITTTGTTGSALVRFLVIGA